MLVFSWYLSFRAVISLKQTLAINIYRNYVKNTFLTKLRPPYTTTAHTNTTYKYPRGKLVEPTDDIGHFCSDRRSYHQVYSYLRIKIISSYRYDQSPGGATPTIFVNIFNKYHIHTYKALEGYESKKNF